ncbi:MULTISPECIES: CHAP domain-containing protein [Gardnerella]|uniref:CHAP domain-containing protein n=1 Tax=Gardnerella TaxID=2701 RepID=UPI0007E433AF|nr:MULTISPECIES: CHAP domain-containing protein [Gardnerella]PMC44670.1 CHAP domain-containing protein [Gardnerella vaginalis]RIY28767.1 CHAP domain-containing protein [Bifidobacteriaceae bacterium NR016]MDK6295385.1 CHAP domain-containing protein [Gardnerella swidsinskii]MDK8691804.1 CHAP domain-containing protein [Gardnerella swidsinskii]PMC50873.1 CHAP domain-containing protein [Gardnerella vaginalis]
MRHAAHGATKAKRRGDSPLSLFVAQHGAHGAHSVRGMRSVQTNRVSERLAAVATSNGAVVELPEAVSERLQELVPQSRRALRLSKLANERRHNVILSASLVAMVGTVAATMALTKVNSFDARASEFEPSMTAVGDASSTVSRSSQRESLDPMATINNAVDSIENAAKKSHNAGSADAANSANEDSSARSDSKHGNLANKVANSVQPGTFSTISSKSDSWNLGSDSGFNIAEMSRSAANNPKVALLIDKDFDVLPKGFNPNHATGDTGNAYEFSQCTWWVYIRRHQLGLPVGSHFGNGNMWADSARSLGYWVDNSARHVGDIMVFRSGQAGSDPFYGHVAVVEKINSDGSIETSECGASYQGRTFSRKFDAKEVSQYQFIHY